MIEVTLTASELLRGSLVGAQRHIQALAENRPDAYGYNHPDQVWQHHIEGALGELAFAKALRLYWEGPVGTFKQGADVGPYQIRTRSKKWYDLIVRPDARDEDKYVLVLGQAPTYQVIGWILARDAKQITPQGYGNRPLAHFVPVAHLHPINA